MGPIADPADTGEKHNWEARTVDVTYSCIADRYNQQSTHAWTMGFANSKLSVSKSTSKEVQVMFSEKMQVQMHVFSKNANGNAKSLTSDF